MSDDVLRLIPTDPAWQPDEDAAEKPAQRLRELTPAAESVDVELRREVTFYDQG